MKPPKQTASGNGSRRCNHSPIRDMRTQGVFVGILVALYPLLTGLDPRLVSPVSPRRPLRRA